MKRHLFSAFVTFITAFCLYFVTVIDSITMESFTDGSFVALAFVGARAGIKALMEYLLVSTAK